MSRRMKLVLGWAILILLAVALVLSLWILGGPKGLVVLLVAVVTAGLVVLGVGLVVENL